MPVDPQANAKDKAKAIATIIFFVVAMVIIYVITQMTGNTPPAPK